MPWYQGGRKIQWNLTPPHWYRLYCSILSYSTSFYFTLYCIASYWLYYIILYYIILYYIKLYYIILIVLHCILIYYILSSYIQYIEVHYICIPRFYQISHHGFWDKGRSDGFLYNHLYKLTIWFCHVQGKNDLPTPVNLMWMCMQPSRFKNPSLRLLLVESAHVFFLLKKLKWIGGANVRTGVLSNVGDRSSQACACVLKLVL